jgi:hypothetical protein
MRTLMFDTYLEKVGSELNPVVDEKANWYKRPYGAEERKVAKLNDHFCDVVLDIVW